MSRGSNATSMTAVEAGLAWLERCQADTGELPAMASSLVDGPPQWTPDSLKFITALIAVALDGLDAPVAVGIVDRAVAFLRRERERSAQWRYWSRSSDLYDYTPPDVDDTACCSLAVATRGDSTAENVAVLLANRDADGRFYTWLLPRPGIRSPRWWWAVRDERRATTRRRRAELWQNSEARPDDVDGVVNANVIRYLGPEHAPVEAIDWVRTIVEDGREAHCDSWHRNRFTMYASIGDGARRGITAFERLGPVIVDRVADRVDGRGTVGPALDTAFALQAVQALGGSELLRRRLTEGLLALQQPDGSWEQSVFYYGGPKEQFGWASAALSTATAVAAVAES